MIGNKRALLGFIETVVEDVQRRIGRKLRVADVFAGSGVVSRMLAAHASHILSNDIEPYGELYAQCFLEKPRDPELVRTLIDQMNAAEPIEGIVTQNYAPRDTENIQVGERCFFTHENAKRIDAARAFVDTAPDWARPYLIAPLLVQMSIQANTQGIFNSFCKDKNTGLGAFYKGKKCKDLFVIHAPVFNPHACDVECTRMDANALIQNTDKTFDLIYIDSPYNQHSYASNYHLLNTVASNVMPDDVSPNSGIPKEKQGSAYYKKRTIGNAMRDLLANATLKSAYVLVSFSDEGHLKADDWKSILEPYTVEIFEKEHRSTLGTRNPKKRGRTEVKELLYLLSRPAA